MMIFFKFRPLLLLLVSSGTESAALHLPRPAGERCLHLAIDPTDLSWERCWRSVPHLAEAGTMGKRQGHMSRWGSAHQFYFWQGVYQ